MSWSQWFGLKYIFMQSMLQASLYVGLAASGDIFTVLTHIQTEHSGRICWMRRDSSQIVCPTVSMLSRNLYPAF